MSNRTMHAAAIEAFGETEQLRVRELPLPIPGPGQVRIRIVAAAVNPADPGMVKGTYRWREPVRFPLVPGYDAAGIVDAVGKDVIRFHEGDRVIAFSQHSLTQAGTYAEYVVLPEKNLALVPDGVEMRDAASLPLAGLTALQALEYLSLTSKQTLLINGPLGAVGNIAMQLATQQGIRVIAPTYTHDADLARSLGASIILNREKDLTEQARQAIPDGVDAALDVVGGTVALSAFAAVRNGGCYATVVPEWWIPGGQFSPQRNITPHLVLVRSNADQLEQLSQWLATGRLKPLIAKVLPLEQAAEAHRLLATGTLRGKIILLP